MNTYVSFELAKLLKEKGFDEYCLFVWNEENLEEPYYYAEHYEMICQRIHYYGDIPLINNSYIEKYATYVEKDEVTEEVYELIAAPTIAEVVCWCFNKYKYSIEYSMNIPESGEYDGCYVFNGLIKGSEDYKLKIFYTSKDYPTIEKALEDTINHFLVNFC